MLVLTMRLHDKVFIGDDVVIQLIRNEHGHIQIGFEAPIEVVILREKIKLEQDERRNRHDT